MSENTKKQLAEIHNILFSMDVKGDAMLKTSTCVMMLRKILQESEINQETDDKGIKLG